MLYSPMAMPQATPKSEPKDGDMPNDLLGWLEKSLLGGQGVSDIDPTMANLLSGLLGSQVAGSGNGK